MTSGDWAAWVAGIGTVLAFAATSLSIHRDHRLRRVEHADAMYDEALKVTTTTGQGAEYVLETSPDGTKERKPITKVVVTVHNGSRRQISNVEVHVTTRTGEQIGSGSVEFVQAAYDQPFYFDPIEGVWGALGSSPAINALVTLTFKDVEETLWKRGPNGHILRFGRLRWRRRTGRRHAARPTSIP